MFNEGILTLLLFSILEHADIFRIPLVEMVAGTMRKISGEKRYNVNTDKNQIWSSQKQIQPHLFEAIVNRINCYCKELCIRCLTEFWINLYSCITQTLRYIFKFMNYISEKKVVCLFFDFVENLYLFQVTMPRAFLLLKKSIFQA